eukprot:1149423-Pelagomonas_calceolata.AAC.3
MLLHYIQCFIKIIESISTKLQVHEVLPRSSVTFAVALVRLQRASVVFEVSVHVEKLPARSPPDTLFRAKPAAVLCSLVPCILAA